jgi:hypothetical protein
MPIVKKEYWITIPDNSNYEVEKEKRIANTDMSWYLGGDGHIVVVPVEAESEDEALGLSAVKVLEAFKDICNPELTCLPPISAHAIVKYYNKSKRKPQHEQGHIQSLGTGYCNIYFTLMLNADVGSAIEATSVCNEQLEEIIKDQDMVARLDISTRLSLAGWLEKEVYFINYTVGVRVKEDSEVKMIEEASLRLWERVKDLKVYAELDDIFGTSLQAIVKYQIPKRRYLDRQIAERRKRQLEDKTFSFHLED